MTLSRARAGGTVGAAIVGLVGALAGALMALVGATVTDRRQTRQEAVRWQRDNLTAAYDGALRYLLRTANRRSKFTASGGAVLAMEHQREWFDDLVEAQFWVHTLASRCGQAQRERIWEVAATLDGMIDATGHSPQGQHKSE